MKKQLTILLLILGIFFIITSTFYLWLLMFHLKLNPNISINMLKKSCGDSYSLEAYLKARQLLNKQPDEVLSAGELDQISNQLPPKEHHCSRQPIFIRTK